MPVPHRPLARLGRALLVLAALRGERLAAQTPARSAPRSAAAPIVVRAATVLDGRGGARQRVDVVVVGDRIQSIRPAAGRADIDLGDRVLAPGLIDTHVHLGWYINEHERLHQRNDGDDDRLAEVHATANAQRMLQAGFTTVQSVGGSEDKAVRDAIARGVIAGPRILTSLGSLSETAGPPDSVRAVVRRFKQSGADLIKIFASKSIREGGAQTMTQPQLDAACGEAKALGLRSVVHAHSSAAAQAAVRAGCTQVDHGALIDQATIDAMAAAGTYFEPQCELVFRNYLDHKEWFRGIGNYNDEGFASMEKAIPLRRAVGDMWRAKKSLKVVYGTDAVAGAHGKNAQDLVCRVMALGQPAIEALTSATSLSAESMGLGTTIGSVAPGYAADLIAFDGDPRQDTQAFMRVAFVMKGGVVQRMPPRAAGPSTVFP